MNELTELLAITNRTHFITRNTEGQRFYLPAETRKHPGLIVDRRPYPYIKFATQRHDLNYALQTLVQLPQTVCALYTGSSTDDLKIRGDHQKADLKS